ncbi:BTAD domain-containing putative transcriptional regulator [Actinomadura sp. 9N407]|uniref:BTAD domain-containing putative transcriptional regulator n=1 Tax=Actinomadura sp. 9N407 TaxID=3375154 RepID=UPI0037A17596
MRFGVLGPLEVRTDGGRPVPIPELKVRALLADLLVHDGRAVSSGRLIEDLWGQDHPGNPTGSLRAKVSQLRRALEEAEAGGRALVESSPPGYRLAAGDIDARRFGELIVQARRAGDPAARAALLTDALALWRGPAFADFAERDFARGTVTRLEEERLTALDDLAEARLALGEHHALVAELSDQAERNPLRERLQANLMRALYRSGRQHEALEGYRRLRERLRDELGLDPSSELTDLHQAILEQDPSLQAPPVAAPRTNLPVALTELVGRSAAVGDVQDLLQRSRLVTLTGPGGVGKTRLALEAAARSAESFPDGVFLVELASLPPTPEAIEDAVADARPGDGALLVLDNCEHVIEPVAKLADRLLRSGARILATSQEPLGIAGELLQVVPPLGLDDSVRLFTARAAAVAPGFTLDPGDSGDADAVAAICRRLDGIPLALELAAARVRALGVRPLADRLDDRFALLKSGRRGSPARQRTLRAMMDWSWEPLAAPERAVLRRLAVHAGGCTLEAAEETCAGDDVARSEIADVIARLVDRSLVTMVGGRYRLLESVAAYCLERLREAGEDTRVQELHDIYYTRVAECAEAYRQAHARIRWLGRLDAETPNLRGALEGATRRGDTALARRLTSTLAWYWIERGREDEARRALGTVLDEEAFDDAWRRSSVPLVSTGSALAASGSDCYAQCTPRP